MLTAIASVAALSQILAAGVAQSPLIEMQERIAGTLEADSFCMVKRYGGIETRLPAAGITVALMTALFVSALIYAAIQ